MLRSFVQAYTYLDKTRLDHINWFDQFDREQETMSNLEKIMYWISGKLNQSGLNYFNEK